MKALVTGGTGFGGSHLCELLLGRGADVTVLDLRPLSDSPYLASKGLCGGIRFIQGDIRDLDLVCRVLREHGIETVFHLAAQPIVPKSIEEPFETLSHNAMGTYAVLEAARTASRPPGIVFASSGAYYGQTFEDRAIPEEDAPEAAANLYSPSKVAADIAVRCYARTYGLKTAACRFINTYGPGDTNFSRIVPRAVKNLLEGVPYDFGERDDGTTKLTYLHVGDMAAAYLACAERLDFVSGQAINFGTDRPMTTRELAVLASRMFDGKEREPVFRGVRKERQVVKILDCRRALDLLAWRPIVCLEDGLREAIEWYRRWGKA
ncbi:MAG: NAD(P)-dependent oxidoreductase [Elusimicrobiota bacterium]